MSKKHKKSKEVINLETEIKKTDQEIKDLVSYKKKMELLIEKANETLFGSNAGKKGIKKRAAKSVRKTVKKAAKRGR